MLVAAGPGVANIKDYTNTTEMDSINIVASQGDTLPTAKCQIIDRLSAYTITDEVDFFILDENDPTGWPTVNLINNSTFAPPVSSGVAIPWSPIQTGSGMTYSAGTLFYNTTTSQRISISNAANGALVGVVQAVILPTDETGSPIIVMPYYLSFWVNSTTAPTNALVRVEIDWKTSAGATISSVSTDIQTSLVTGVWNRYFCTGTPPSNAAIANVHIFYITTSATNGGSMTVTAAQFERATFGYVSSLSYAPYLENTGMQSQSLSGVVDGWTKNTISGATFSIDNTITYKYASQKIVLSNATNGGFANIQQNAKFSPYGKYSLSLVYKVLSALTNCRVQITANYYDNGNTFLSSSTTTVSLMPLNSWNTLTLNIGPGTGNVAPINASTVGVQVGLSTINASNSGTLYIGQVTASAAAIPQQVANASMTAMQAGRYPTTYCDLNQLGCRYDTDFTGLAFRQMRYFGGYIRTTSFDYSTSPERTIDIDAVGYGIMLAESPANLVLRSIQDTAGIASAILYARNQGFLQGLNYTNYVQPISVIDSLSFSWQSTKDVITQIANLAVADWWVDEYKYLHYQPALASPGPFGFSDAPNLTTTFPMAGWRFDNDSTQSVTTKVFEGGSVISLPVVQNFHGVATTLNATLTSGNTYTSITVVALTTNCDAGTILTINNGSTTQDVTVFTSALSGATTLTVVSFTASDTFTAGNTVRAYSFLLNGGAAIYQVDGSTVDSVAQYIGINGINTFAQGYDALVDPVNAVITFSVYPPNSKVVTVTYRYSAPVIVRVRNSGAETIYGAIKRRIHHHQQDQTITSITTAYARGQSELYQYSKPRPIGKIKFYSPPAPLAKHIMPGVSVNVTHTASKLNAAPFQVQRVTVTQVGPGVVCYELDVGFYRLDLAMLVYQSRQKLLTTNTDTQGVVIVDVLSLNDGWVMTDNITAPTIANIGTWAPPTVSTWDGILAWG